MTQAHINGILTSMAEATQKKILVVDDELDILEGLSSVLRRANYEVRATTKGSEVLELAKGFGPDLVILDIYLPDMEGSEVASLLSQQPATANIPIVFLTGAVITKTEEPSSKRIGRNYLLAKPTTSAELLDMVKKALLPG